MLMELEPLIIARLAAIPSLLGAYGAAEFAGVAKAGKPSPCAYVVYGGYRPLQSSEDGAVARVEESWMVALSLKSASPAQGADPARAAARPEVEAVLRAFMGWRPESQSYKAFRLAPGPRPEAEPARLLVPIVFTVEHVINLDAAPVSL
ncbi:MAG: hypothetical protein PHI64_19450 [Zoogloea sp.]|uniref:phage tail terminator protein n=1 Tax=Zoogloea sp. TaxID=49181 RepID=UPI002606EC21|nr:hypothetical protein [Zoogloea sp.]MDD2991116.1 hypothetical protein [Zoogloea sp.]